MTWTFFCGEGGGGRGDLTGRLTKNRLKHLFLLGGFYFTFFFRVKIKMSNNGFFHPQIVYED